MVASQAPKIMADCGVYFSHELREIWRSANDAQTGDSSSEQLKNLTSELGQKTVGILKFPVKWTIEKFAVISHGACKDFLLSNSEIEIDKAIRIAVSYFDATPPGFEFIVRSSAANESLLARGKYKSIKTGNSFDSVRNGVFEVLRSFKSDAIESITSHHFSVLIHQHLPAEFHGHLSNERRVGFCHYFNDAVTGSKRSFLAELWEGDGDEPKDTFTLQSKKGVVEPSQDSSISIDSKTSAKALRELARWVHKRIGRGHLEWIAHAGKLLVVQCDVESETPVKEPLYLWRSHSGNFDASRLKVFALATKENCSDLRKTRSKLVFQACSLPVAPLYLLRSESEIESILSGEISEMTYSDIQELAEYPLVIRIDVVTEGNEDWENLPASPPIIGFENAKRFLIDNLPSARTRVQRTADLAIVVHHFIPSKAAAWAEANNDHARIRIDATWGHPDGLQSFPCDSVYVSLHLERQFLFRRFKHTYLDIGEDGKPYRRVNGPHWDIQPVLQDNDIKQISLQTLEVSRHLGKPVRLMWFVGTETDIEIPRCFPWIVVEDFSKSADPFLSGKQDLPLKASVETIAQARRLALGNIKRIETETDIDEFKLAPTKFDLGGRRVVLCPSATLVRSKMFLEKVANAVKELSWRLVLEGSSLAHAFYQLTSFGVTVECASEYLTEPKRRRIYRKLVRDKIPGGISEKGELINFRRIPSDQLKQALQRKLVEEAFEALGASTKESLIEEMADVYEVMRAISKLIDVDMHEVEEKADRKKDKKGGFELGYELLATGGISSVSESKFDKLHYVRSRSQEQFTSIQIPLIPPSKPSSQEQFRISVGDKVLQATLVYTGNKVELHIGSFDENPDDPQIDLFPEKRES